MAPKSLVELCMDACQRNLSQLTSFGDADFLLPPEHVHELLSKINDPVQLRTIEINSPHLSTETPLYWKRIIQKEFPVESRESNYTPRNPDKWYKIYEKYRAERLESQKEAEERLRERFQGIQAKKDSNISHIVDPRFLPRPPKTGRTFGTRGPALEKATSNLAFTRGSRTKNALTKARRQAVEYKLMRTSLSNPFRQAPTGSVRSAPVGMVNEKRIATQPTFRASSSLQRGSARLPPQRPKSAGMDHANGPPNYIDDSSGNEGDPFSDDEAPSYKRARTSTGYTGSSQRLGTSAGSSGSSSQPARRPGLLNNAPRSRPGGASSSSTSSRRADVRTSGGGTQRPEPSRAAQSSPPPAAPSPINASAQQQAGKKRKVDIFMPPKRRKV